MLGSLFSLTLGISSTFAAGSIGGEGHAGGGFEDGGNTLVSAMMMFVGNDQNVYILDKSEGNQAQVNGHPAMGAVYNIASRTATPMEIRTNPFCSSGMHMPDGSFLTFGGNQAVGPGGDPGDTGGGAFDTTYGDYDGRNSVRILNPVGCNTPDDATSSACQWLDDPTVNHLQSKRWYSSAEPRGDGTVSLVGGFQSGGYIDRNYPIDNDPVWQGNASQPTYESWPSNGPPVLMNFLVETGGLNAYAHAFTLASGKMLLQANVSTILWTPDGGNDIETPLPPMPDNLVRVYPASAAVAMMPMTPANNYEQTVLFCGGNDMPDAAWGNYSWPWIDTWLYPASPRCHQLTPEPLDGSTPEYVEDDPMPKGRTMGQFILLPSGQMLVVNGGVNGTAGYSQRTLNTVEYGDMPYGESLASGPVGTPVLYTPSAPAGQRWSSAGLDTSPIARLYHSSAILLPDASVLIAGSNPNYDVNISTIFPTTYQAEIWYPPYFSAPVRPVPSGVPSNISYGGPSFDITVPASSYSGPTNDAADGTAIWLMRPGFTTHAMNMGQRALQLNNTYTVSQDGSFVLHVAQAPSNSNIFQPGPAFLFVTVKGIPSNGTYVLVGNGQVGQQPTAAPADLPAIVRLDGVQGTGPASSTSSPAGGNGNGNSGSNNGGSDNKNAATSSSPQLLIVAIASIFALAGVFL